MYSNNIFKVTVQNVFNHNTDLIFHTLCFNAAFPGPPAPPKIIDAYDDCINIAWTAPNKTGGSRILGYILEKRKKGSNLWSPVQVSSELIKGMPTLDVIICTKMSQLLPFLYREEILCKRCCNRFGVRI